jgi:hypothetical protein
LARASTSVLSWAHVPRWPFFQKIQLSSPIINYFCCFGQIRWLPDLLYLSSQNIVGNAGVSAYIHA